VKRPAFMAVMIHLLVWLLLFLLPYFMITRNNAGISMMEYLRHGGFDTLTYLCVFYINYFWLIPKYMFRGKFGYFIALNILILALLAGGAQLWHHYDYIVAQATETRPQTRKGPPRWAFIYRDVLILFLVACTSVAIRMVMRWSHIETARKEAEVAQTAAELKNLRSQLNPHFLLNTLNNIYALIAFDSDKAQNAVQDLSKLLRHALYDNTQQYTTMQKEMDFMQNYIELMRIRLSDNVDLQTTFSVRKESQTQVAPLLFISLVENAFKHGISPTEPSYIHIAFEETADKVRCEIRNSNFPKNTSDKSGSGIGLEQVKRRLDLSYPGKYEWNYGTSDDGKEYFSILAIETN